jgi:hypothetical protein
LSHIFGIAGDSINVSAKFTAVKDATLPVLAVTQRNAGIIIFAGLENDYYAAVSHPRLPS